MTVEELGRRMSAAEYTRWIAFYRDEARRTEAARKEAAASRRGR